MNRIGEALKRPGLDTRQWVSLAIVEAITYDAVEGPYADVRLMPANELVTARIGAAYAGNGFGIWAPLYVDDEVMVCLPDGDQGIGWVVTARMWSPSDPPPSEASEALSDLVVRVEAGKNVLIKVTGDGEVQLVGPDGEKMPMGETLQTMLSTLMTDLATHTHTCAVGPTTPPVNAASFTGHKVTPIDDGKMLSDHATLEK